MSETRRQGTIKNAKERAATRAGWGTSPLRAAWARLEAFRLLLQHHGVTRVPNEGAKA